MKIKDKKKLILQALYEKGLNGNSYDIVKLTLPHFMLDYDEAQSIIESLQAHNLVIMCATRESIDAALTADGAEYVENILEEQNCQTYQPEDRFTPEEQASIVTKLDNFADALERLEIGQQIIYDDLRAEIHEMKELFDVLGKKHWTQMLKGKLVDAGLGYISEKVITLIANTFTNKDLPQVSLLE